MTQDFAAGWVEFLPPQGKEKRVSFSFPSSLFAFLYGCPMVALETKTPSRNGWGFSLEITQRLCVHICVPFFFKIKRAFFSTLFFLYRISIIDSSCSKYARVPPREFHHGIESRHPRFLQIPKEPAPPHQAYSIIILPSQNWPLLSFTNIR